jgi:hypothetical protein
MNVDGAFRPSELKVGGDGVVVTDCHGGFVLEALPFSPHVADAEGSEMLACKRVFLGKSPF